MVELERGCKMQSSSSSAARQTCSPFATLLFSMSLILAASATVRAGVDEVLFTVELAAPDSRLAIVDKQTGAIVQWFPQQSDVLIDGMAYDPSTDTLFGFDPGDGLYAIDRATGSFALVGSQSSANIGGLAVHPTTFDLFGISVFGGSLWQIDKMSGVTTLIEPAADDLGLAHGLTFAADGTLYASDTSGEGISSLFTIDPMTGDASFVSAIDRDFIVGLAFDFSGVLFGSDNGTHSLTTIDKDTGTATTIGPYGGFFHNSLAFVPEPATLTLLAMGVLAVATRRRRSI